jgi:nucleoside 2-deoxyribosyltransferase
VNAVVYLAHPISGGSHAVEAKNQRRAEREAYRLTRAGFAVVLPGWDVALKGEELELGWHTWLKRDLALVARCDAVFVMPDLLVRPSKGVAREVAFARARGIPVCYTIAGLKAATARYAGGDVDAYVKQRVMA